MVYNVKSIKVKKGGTLYLIDKDRVVKLAGEKLPLLNIESWEFGVPIISFGSMDDRPSDDSFWYGYNNNLYMESLMNLTQSSLHNSLLHFKQKMIVADGLLYEENDEFTRFLANIAEKYDADELLRRSALDLVMFGGFCWQVKWGATGKQVTGIQHVSFHKARHGQTTEESPDPRFFVSPDWNTFQTTQKFCRPVEFPAYDPLRVDIQRPQLYWRREYTNLIDYYPLPDYYGCLDYIELDIRLASFQLNNVRNGFVPTGMLSLPDQPSSEEQLEKIKLVKEQYQGDVNGGQLLVFFGSDGGSVDGKKTMPEFTPITTDNNADIYNTLSDIVQQRIISGHGLSSPTLAGIAGAGGLGGNASEIRTAHRFFYETKIKDYQRILVSSLKEVLRHTEFAAAAADIRLGYSSPIESEDYSETVLMQTMTINEIREERGLEPINGGDVFPGTAMIAAASPQPIKPEINAS